MTALCCVCGRPVAECDGKTCERPVVELTQQTIELALMVAESDHGQAGPNTARVLAFEVRRLRVRVHTLELALKARTSMHDADQVTLEQIEQACTRHGYEAAGGQPVAEWIDQRLLKEPPP